MKFNGIGWKSHIICHFDNGTDMTFNILSTPNAYASWLCGYVRSIISRGLETPSSKVYIRATVLIFDALIYILALVHFITSSSPTPLE